MKGNDKENSFRGVTLTVLSQRLIPQNQVPYVGDDVIDFSDLIVRFRIENRGKEDIYYLADVVSNGIEPVGFQLLRDSKRAEWDTTYSPARGREDIFTGDLFKWLLLSPGCALEFERTDLSFKGREHATTVFLNTEPEHKSRVELVSNVYRPLKRKRPFNKLHPRTL